MTGDELRNIRGDKTREEFAAHLGGCSASTVNKWERNINPIPEWVVEKIFRGVELRLPLHELSALLHHATETKTNFDDMLTQSIRDYLTAHRAKIAPMPSTEEESATKKKAPSKQRSA